MSTKECLPKKEGAWKSYIIITKHASGNEAKQMDIRHIST